MPLEKKPSNRMTFAQNVMTASALACFAAVGAALISQHLFDMLPCAWCIAQRMIFILTGLVAMFGLLFPVNAVKRLSLIGILILSLIGMAAAWHQWTVAAAQFSCDQTLADRIVSGSGLDASVPWLFGIYATCMDAAVSVLGIDFAVWSLMLFGAIALASMVALRTTRSR